MNASYCGMIVTRSQLLLVVDDDTMLRSARTDIAPSSEIHSAVELALHTHVPPDAGVVIVDTGANPTLPVSPVNGNGLLIPQLLHNSHRSPIKIVNPHAAWAGLVGQSPVNLTAQKFEPEGPYVILQAVNTPKELTIDSCVVVDNTVAPGSGKKEIGLFPHPMPIDMATAITGLANHEARGLPVAVCLAAYGTEFETGTVRKLAHLLESVFCRVGLYIGSTNVAAGALMLAQSYGRV